VDEMRLDLGSEHGVVERGCFEALPVLSSRGALALGMGFSS
jgi:hypothetical protein